MRQSLGHGGLVRTYTLISPRSLQLGASPCRGDRATHAGPASGQVSEGGPGFSRRSIKSQPFSPSPQRAHRRGGFCAEMKAPEPWLGCGHAGTPGPESLALCCACPSLYCSPSWAPSSVWLVYGHHLLCVGFASITLPSAFFASISLTRFPHSWFK